jgi:CRISPR-associated protein Cas1
LADTIAALGRIGERLDRAQGVDAVRGVEGEAGREYFGVFQELIAGEPGGFEFRGRSRRPPLDPVNAMLSFAYTLLTHECESACEAVGLDPAVGFLHADRPGRASLALDLVEEFRAPLADRLVLALINRRQVKSAGFTRTESGAVLMDEATRAELLTVWQQRKREEIKHPFLNETVPVGLLPYVQALLLARWIRADLDAYPAMIWR